ncbi:hypothetical protein FDP41_007628 [Naegleria fowleri]|uniref:TPX2 central domain-containing protein n=1 Tax=Naegleria fowleri TaxID=5763 RepID=A0A6A5BZX5_NAEFO|nr:uncharacterized protein FDP41_007628 [Naegleria fowleri]KAF0983713.1 hypothetical protein FDP41_007628 [Naegleria fowleri]
MSNHDNHTASTTSTMTTSNEEQVSIIEEEWEFKAPKYFDFDKLLVSNSTQQPHAEDAHNKSQTDQWFFTEDAQHLEFLDPKYIDLNGNNSQQQNIWVPNQESSSSSSHLHNHDDITLSNISTISKFSVHHDDGASLYSSASNIPSIMSAFNNNNNNNNNNNRNNYCSSTILQNSHHPLHHNKPRSSRRAAPKLTIPVTPKFMTDQRMKQRSVLNASHNNMKNNNPTSKAPFLMTTSHMTTSSSSTSTQSILSSTSTTCNTLKTLKSSVDNKERLTKFKTVTRPKLISPKPFKFATESRAEANGTKNTSSIQLPPGHSPFNKSMLQKINEMRNKIPSRWKCNSSLQPSTPLSSKPLKITKPSSFKLRTKFRSRTRAVPQVVENVVRVEFKARPLNRKIFESSGQIGLGRVVKREITHPEEFNLLTDERIKKRKLDQSKIVDESMSSNISHTRPIKTRKLDNTTSTSTLQQSILQTSKSVKPPTIPESPNLRTKQRAHARAAPQPATPNSPHITFRARPLPVTTLQNPFVPTLTEHITTVPEPFHLKTEQRGALHRKQFESRIIEEEEKENESRHFKARPILKAASLCSDALSTRSNVIKPLPITVPVSPKLLTKNRVRSEDSILKSVIIGPSLPNTSTFRARPMPNFNLTSNSSNHHLSKVSKNMDLTTTTHTTTHVEPFHLRTEERGQAYQTKFKTHMEELLSKQTSETLDHSSSSFNNTKKKGSTAFNLRL